MWDHRVDQMSRQKFFDEQKQWENQHARDAPHVSYVEDTQDTALMSQELIYQSPTGDYHSRQPNHHWRDEMQTSGTSFTLGTDHAPQESTTDEVDAFAITERDEMDALIAQQVEDGSFSPSYGFEDEELEHALAEGVDWGEAMDMS
ncbi:MAG: hypothetical protein Q9159_005896 [Coniocarpon cinnabarinum]